MGGEQGLLRQGTGLIAAESASHGSGVQSGSGLDPSGPHNGEEIVEHAVKDEFASEHHARTTAIAIQPAAQNGTSGLLADGKHARRWATLPPPRTGDRGHSGRVHGVVRTVNHRSDILMISGSLRSASTNTAILRTAEKVAPPGMVLALYEGVSTLPHFNPDDDSSPSNVEVEKLRATIRAADAVLFSTPEYAGDLPGSLKNVLDWAVGDDQAGSMHGKPVAWINCSQRGASDAHAALRRVLGYLGARIIEEACVHIPLGRDAVGSDGSIASADVRRPLADALSQLAGAT